MHVSCLEISGKMSEMPPCIFSKDNGEKNSSDIIMLIHYAHLVCLWNEPRDRPETYSIFGPNIEKTVHFLSLSELTSFLDNWRQFKYPQASAVLQRNRYNDVHNFIEHTQLKS